MNSTNSYLIFPLAKQTRLPFSLSKISSSSSFEMLPVDIWGGYHIATFLKAAYSHHTWKMNNNLYVYMYEAKLVVVNRWEWSTLISPIGKDYLRKETYTNIHTGIIVIRILSQAREGLDSKQHLYLYDSRFYDHEQAQIAST